MDIKIEKNIPLVRKKDCKYKFLMKLEVGDSFLYPLTLQNKKALYEASRRFGVKISIRIVEEAMRWENKTCSHVMRIWRVK